MNSQEQINEIYTILKKQESRRKWGLFFLWTKRIIIWGIILLIVFFPKQILSTVKSFIVPIVQQAIEESFEKNKNALAEQAKNAKDSLLEEAKNLIKKERQNSYDY